MQIVEYMSTRPEEDGQPVHVINVDVQDNHEEATIGAFVVCELANMVWLFPLVIYSHFPLITVAITR